MPENTPVSTGRSAPPNLRESLGRLKDYLNANVTDVSKCRCITLTYKSVMSDSERLYCDFKIFNRRCRKLYGHYEYITACEYQKRGSLHLHCVFICDSKAPFMKNSEVAKLWGQGFVNIRKITNVNDVGRYLTAYVGDAFLSDLERVPDDVQREHVKTVEVKENGSTVEKTVIKGARLALVPPGFNMYRISKPAPTMRGFISRLSRHSKSYPLSGVRRWNRLLFSPPTMVYAVVKYSVVNGAR